MPLMLEPLLLTREEAMTLAAELKAAREKAWREGRKPTPWRPEQLPSQPQECSREVSWFLR
jgi:hypothetical protein